jgi:hypothetical protein
MIYITPTSIILRIGLLRGRLSKLKNILLSNKYINMKYFFFNALILLVCFSTNAQSRISINGIDIINKTGNSFFKAFSSGSATQVYSSVPDYCLDFFSNNKKFVTVDRKNLTLLSKEKELQKSEDFIDGYIVEQGKSEGVDFICKPIYYEDKKLLNIRIYDVASGHIKCSKERNLESNFMGIKNLEKQVRYLMHELMWDCFGTKFTILRPTDPKDTNAKKLIVAIGSKSKAEVEDDLDIFEYVEEEVDGDKIYRKQVIGRGRIELIQDGNFSEVKVKDGNKQVAALLAAGKKVYCTIINKYHED